MTSPYLTLPLILCLFILMMGCVVFILHWVMSKPVVFAAALISSLCFVVLHALGVA